MTIRQVKGREAPTCSRLDNHTHSPSHRVEAQNFQQLEPERDWRLVLTIISLHESQHLGDGEPPLQVTRPLKERVGVSRARL